jgi:predicted TIM-barrel fold metal-dependent hydrolase
VSHDGRLLAGLLALIAVPLAALAAVFAADSGAFYSSITPATAAQYQLKTYPAPYGLHVTGIGGEADMAVAKVKTFTLAGVAADFPDMKIIIAHPSWPWQDEALSVCLHKPNVCIDLSGWSPKYFPPQLIQYANTRLKRKMLFGSDFPLISPERRIKDFREAGFKPEVHDLILKENAIATLGLG